LWRYGLSLRMRHKREERGRSECGRHTNVRHGYPPFGRYSIKLSFYLNWQCDRRH
jgi:hypothetical protein